MFDFLIDLFDWPRRRRRQKWAGRPTTPEMERTINDSVSYYAAWPDSIRQKMQRAVKIMVAEKNWEGCDGLVINDEIKITIAAQASLMLVGVDNYYFDGLHTILVFPESFEREIQDGLIRGQQSLAGEAWTDGRITFSWVDVLRGCQFPNDGQNVVIHEFAHHIDAISGFMDGQPQMNRGVDQKLWRQVSEQDYQQLVSEVQSMKPTVLDPYGTINQAEFFAVASESFFEMPMLLQQEHPQLYSLLCGLYQVDPGSWQR